MADPSANRSSTILAGSIAPIVAATIAVFLRFVARKISSATYWWDDWVIAFSLVINYGLAALRWIQIRYYGFGRHADTLSRNTIIGFWKSFLAVQVFYFLNTSTTKISLLLLYYQIFGVDRRFRMALFFAASVVLSFFISCMIATFAGCHPLSYWWNKYQPSGSCINEIAFFFWNGLANLLMDVMILCLPMPMVWRLKIEWRQKLILSGIFLLGAFVCAASIIRVSVFHEIKVKDITYTQVNTATWSCVEQSLGIICACLPTMRPLLGRILHTTKRSGGSDTKESHARSRPVTIELGTKKLGWNGSANDGDSTVGFARLPEEYPTPGLSQPPGYPLNGATAISTTVAPVSQDPSLDLAPQTIVKKQEIEQRSYAV